MCTIQAQDLRRKLLGSDAGACFGAGAEYSAAAARWLTLVANVVAERVRTRAEFDALLQALVRDAASPLAGSLVLHELGNFGIYYEYPGSSHAGTPPPNVARLGRERGRDYRVANAIWVVLFDRCFLALHDGVRRVFPQFKRDLEAGTMPPRAIVETIWRASYGGTGRTDPSQVTGQCLIS